MPDTDTGPIGHSVAMIVGRVGRAAYLIPRDTRRMIISAKRSAVSRVFGTGKFA